MDEPAFHVAFSTLGEAQRFATLVRAYGGRAMLILEGDRGFVVAVLGDREIVETAIRLTPGASVRRRPPEGKAR